MAEQISINTAVAGEVYQYAKTETQNLRDQMNQLNTRIESLLSEGEWRGAASDTFFSEYQDVKKAITTTMPQVLDDLAKNLDTNLKNLVAADQAGASK